MILQQEDEVAIWGWDATLKNITLEGSLGQKAIVNTSGEWETKIQTPSSGGPYTMIIFW